MFNSIHIHQFIGDNLIQILPRLVLKLKSYQLRTVLALLIVVNMILIKVLYYKFQAYSIDLN